MTNVTVYVVDWHIYSTFVAILVLGLCLLLRRLRRATGAYKFTQSFRDQFRTYCNSQGSDHAAYDWLIRHSNRMQKEMGPYGIYGSYKPPFANYAYSNYPIILNMLPELRTHIEQDFGGSLYSETINGFMRAIDEALLRYIGVLEQRRSSRRSDLLNPFLWLREGIGFILTLPLLLLSWFGILGSSMLRRIQASFPFRVLSALGGLLGLAASAMTLVLGWTETVQLLFHLIG